MYIAKLSRRFVLRIHLIHYKSTWTRLVMAVGYAIKRRPNSDVLLVLFRQKRVSVDYRAART